MGSNKKLLLQATCIIFFAFCTIISFFYYGKDFINGSSKYLWLYFLGTAIMLLILSYIISTFILHPIFETNNLLSTLLKDTLHELNIPLSTIKANTQLLKKNANPASLKRVQRIEKSSERLYTLYKEVDYYIKKEIYLVEEEIFDLKETVICLSEQISHLDDSITTSIQGKSFFIKTDKIGFQKAVLNLLANAYKYNKPNGTIDITFKDKKLFIKDEGIGMSEEAKFHLFDRYYQQNSSSKGYGIGLSIVKNFCDTNGIFISISSTENRGTTISLNLEHLFIEA